MEKQWLFNGHKLSIQKNGAGCLCGYVSVERESPLWGKTYNDLTEDEIWVDVHGGITWSEDLHGDWTFGFDTSHSWDKMPNHLDISSHGHLWTMDEVAEETMNLSRQIADLEKPAEIETGGG